MRTKISITALALASTAAFAMGTANTVTRAQTPSGGASSQNPDQGTTVRPTTTLIGCLYKEEQVPGRTPNLAEKAGILEDYILADAKTTDPETQSGATGTSGTTGTASGSVPASGNMYKIEKISHDRLKALVGKRVETTGKINPEKRPPGPGSASGAPTTDRGLSRDQINLPELEASSIKEVSGACPAAPAPRK
jgi:hypothetical protein